MYNQVMTKKKKEENMVFVMWIIYLIVANLNNFKYKKPGNSPT